MKGRVNTDVEGDGGGQDVLHALSAVVHAAQSDEESRMFAWHTGKFTLSEWEEWCGASVDCNLLCGSAGLVGLFPVVRIIRSDFNLFHDSE